MNAVIAIDGPSASGKSTVARQVAKELGFTYVDTGAMYRAVTWWAMKSEVAKDSRDAVKGMIQEMKFELPIENGATKVSINGESAEAYLRDADVYANVSVIAAIPEVREFLVNEQRKLRMGGALVMEGRDIGTVVFTDTPLKFFLDADAEVRAQRRAAQGETDNVVKRDQMDSSRKVAPLTKAADAERIDTGMQTAAEISAYIVKKYQESGLADADLSPVEG